MKNQQEKPAKFFPCPCCKGRGQWGSNDAAYLGGDIPEHCGACGGSGNGRDYQKRKAAAQDNGGDQ